METIRMLSMTGDFNPRSRKESDNPSNQLFFPLAYFNPRSRKESDKLLPVFPEEAIRFQSTLSQGERPSVARLHCKDFIFQSTLSQGERPSVARLHCKDFTFQSTLSQGERRIGLRVSETHK